MRLSLDALLVLDSIARNGSFAAAAEELHRVPSAITYTIQKLEQDLAISLFDRSGHSAKLTAIGHALLEELRQLLACASQLEQKMHSLASGWEPELRIAVSDLLDFSAILASVAEFDQYNQGTRLRIQREVFGGTWDALVNQRADLVIGANDHPPVGVLSQPLAQVNFIFAVHPDHPLCQHPQPLSASVIRRYRAIAAADSSRQLPPRSSSLLTGQEVLTVPTIDDKLAAQCAGLGVGFLPERLARPAIAAGQLRELAVQEGKPSTLLFCGWRERQPSHALAWFLQHLAQASISARLCGGI